ncbi:MAG TPA: dipeptide/oligopeptide/nickel ABC transporter permease/ATP-binding protein [Streptosporangiaceae bacterium]|nr:dipeptide/oligopeptide/nickel ABC transporter permease/ATP-binding protein [Streptosporangiaceae bacterium]
MTRGTRGGRGGRGTRGGRKPAWRRLARRPLGVAGAAWLLLVLLGAIFAPGIAPYGPEVQDLSSALSGPTMSHLLGTDPLGRDVLSQLLFGARPTLVGVVAALIAWLVAGVALGVIGGYAGGVTDAAISRVTDLLLSLPVLVVLLVIFSLFPDALVMPMAVLGVIASAGLARVVRSVTLSVREELYIRAARVAGLSHPKIVLRHVLPRIASTVIVQAALFAGVALITESGLAFLGFGIVLPEPSWGGLIAEGSQTLSRSAWLLVPSGGILGLTVVAFVLLGNAIRDTSTQAWSAPRQVAGRRGAPPEHPAEGSAEHSAGHSGDALLSVEHLCVGFADGRGTRPVVSDLSFVIRRGETLAVLGESGCGKTITALAVLGLLPPGARRTGGQVLLGGLDLTALAPREIAAVRGRRIGYIAQDPMVSLDPTFTAGSQIAEAVRRHTGCRRAQARRQAVELLDLVNIPEPQVVARRYPHQLSGGMLQRCVTALALAGSPQLLIADEPTTALDVTIQAEILALLRSLQQERGMSLLLVTHDWGVAAAVADRALVMYAGQLVETATPARLFNGPAHPYTRGLLASSPRLATVGGRLQAIPGSVPTPGMWPAGCRFAPRCPEAEDRCREGPVAVRVAAPGHISRCLHVTSAEAVRQ